MKNLKTYEWFILENYFIDKKIKIIYNGSSISFVYDKEPIINFIIKNDVAVVVGYDVSMFGKGKGEYFILYALDELSNNGIKYIKSFDRGRNEYSNKLWDKLKKRNDVIVSEGIDVTGFMKNNHYYMISKKIKEL